jgi:hypothetical protein
MTETRCGVGAISGYYALIAWVNRQYRAPVDSTTQPSWDAAAV